MGLARAGVACDDTDGRGVDVNSLLLNVGFGVAVASHAGVLSSILAPQAIVKSTQVTAITMNRHMFTLSLGQRRD